jgi:hypothetical protein
LNFLHATGAAEYLNNKGEALLLEPATETPEESINVIVNWMSALKK